VHAGVDRLALLIDSQLPCDVIVHLKRFKAKAEVWVGHKPSHCGRRVDPSPLYLVQSGWVLSDLDRASLL
jgi:hypothetical protein